MDIMLRMRALPAGFIAPCLPTKTDKLPSGSQWLHEIKHDGFRVIARKNGAQGSTAVLAMEARLAKTSLSGPVEGPPARATAASPAQGQSGQNRQLLFGSSVCNPSGGVRRPSECKDPRAKSDHREAADCMSSEHFGQLAWQFERMSGSSGLKVQAAIAC